jgi:hypothetical protein
MRDNEVKDIYVSVREKNIILLDKISDQMMILQMEWNETETKTLDIYQYVQILKHRLSLLEFIQKFHEMKHEMEQQIKEHESKKLLGPKSSCLKNESEI